MRPGKFRVLIVDDHLMWRKTLSLFFSRQPNVEVLEMSVNQRLGESACKRARPNLVILEVSQLGLETARRLLEDIPNLQIIGVTGDMGLHPLRIATKDGIKIVPKNLLADYLSPKRVHRIYGD